MPRVKRGVAHVKHRKNILKATKGYMWGRKSKIKLAKVAILKAGHHAYKHRKAKKREMRSLWQIRIGAAVKAQGLSYSKFMGAIKKAGVVIDRKILAEVAAKYPEAFNTIVALARK